MFVIEDSDGFWGRRIMGDPSHQWVGAVESDISVVNREKDQYRAALTDFSLEGILHAKQFMLVSLFKHF
jgi:hypothetical protein